MAFVYLSLDELTEIHEHWAGVGVSGRGLVFFVLVPAGLAIVAVTGGYVRFLSSLAPRIRRLFIVAAALYVGGAIGVEALDHLIRDHVSDLVLGLHDAVLAETLEMLGTATFIYALLLEIESLRPSVAEREGAGRDREFTALHST